MNKSQRIYFDTLRQDTDAYIKVRLEQDVDSLEFLSMSIDTEDIYQDFNADYGVLVGRVTANGGVGIPNAKISIFIPITQEDEDNGEIKSVYPYKTPRDKNREGKRYNLLPRVSKIDPQTGVVVPKQPFGSFPIKEEIVTNETLLKVYNKYYKYTATTNDGGDYMIFGVPIGTQTVHLSVDITDIGKYSMNPAAMVTNLGYSPNLFTDNNSRIKPSNDLNDLPHIETQEISVDIIPFWGDAENFEIGITRQDFRVRSVLANTFVIFGSVFTDGDGAMWGSDRRTGRAIEELFYARSNRHLTVGMASKRIGQVTEKIFYYPANITDDDIDTNIVDTNKMLQLDPSEYSVYKRDGDFVFIINCNRDKIITDEFGGEVPVANNSSAGVFTKFRGFVLLEITDETIPMQFSSEIGTDTTVTPFRYKLKFPQYAPRNQSFTKPNTSNADIYNANWRKQHYTFSGGSFYSLAKFHGLTYNYDNTDTQQFGLTDGFFKGDYINNANNPNTGNDDYKLKPFNNVGIIVNGSYGIDQFPEPDTSGFLYDNSVFEFPSNSLTRISNETNIPCFGANWMNFSIHFPQLGRMTEGWSNLRDVRVADHFAKQLEKNTSFNRHFFAANTDPIAAGVFNTQFMARSDLNWTDFIYVPIEDIIHLKKISTKGDKTLTDGKTITTSDGPYVLKGKYRNGEYQPQGWSAPCPINGGKENGVPTNSTDTRTYFYKGFDNADCIQFLFELGII